MNGLSRRAIAVGRRLMRLRRRTVDDIDEELRFHLDMRARANMASGMPAGDATRAARRRFGNLLLMRDRCLDVRGSLSRDGLLQDLRYAFRLLRAHPAVTAVVIGTLAVGIGANAAMFSIVNAALYAPLPFDRPDSLVLVWGSKPDADRTDLPLSLPNFRDTRAAARTFDSMSAWVGAKGSVSGNPQPEPVHYGVVSAQFFSTLGVAPMLGRTFLAEEDEPGRPPTAIIAHRLWVRRFAASQRVLGQPIVLNGRSYQVVGVMPPAFRFMTASEEAEVWLPFGQDFFPQRRFVRSLSSLGVVARVKARVTLAEAQSELDRIAHVLEREEPSTNAGWRMRLVPVREQVVGRLRPALVAMTGAVAFVLLIACANVASLLLARARVRRREMAVRAALGASRARVVRQLLIESMVLALAGGAAGLATAAGALHLITSLPFQDGNTLAPYAISAADIRLDTRVLGFAALISIVTGILFGLAPALRLSSANLTPALKEGGGRGAVGTRDPARSLLVVTQIALSIVLLVGASLMARTFVRLQNVSLGFDPHKVLTFEVNLPPARYGAADRITVFYDRLLQDLRALPGVESAGAAEFVPLGGVDASTRTFAEGRPMPGPGEGFQTHYRAVAGDYYEAMGARLVAGRGFTERDAAGAPRVAIVNEALARRHWPGENPIGKRLALDFETMTYRPDGPPRVDLASAFRQIVGVVADMKHAAVDSDALPEMFVPLQQRPVPTMTVAVRAQGDLVHLAGRIRDQVLAIDPDQPIAGVRPMAQRLTESVARRRFNLLLFGVFAAVALALAAVGVYGVMSYAVSQRTRELGVRVALGAASGDVLRLILGDGLKLVLAGILCGLAGSVALSRTMDALLFGVASTDAAAYAAGVAVLGLVALVACYVPARRAARIDPVLALQGE